MVGVPGMWCIRSIVEHFGVALDMLGVARPELESMHQVWLQVCIRR
jgi:hypothetical protein